MYSSLTYGNVIKELRNDRFLSQGELAEDICSQGMLSRIENNDVVPNVLVMQKICEKLNVSVNYVLTKEESSKTTGHNYIELLQQLVQGKKYVKLAEAIEAIEREEGMVFETKIDLQKYAYYKGLSLNETNPGDEASITLLQEGLNYTYNRNKQDTTDMEILLLSQIGKVYVDQGKTELGLSFMKRSITQFYANMRQREHVALIKVFYNSARACVNLQAYDEAIKYIEQGILWSQKKKNYYFLDELYLLKGIVLQDLNRLDEAVEVVMLAETLEKLSDYATAISA